MEWSSESIFILILRLTNFDFPAFWNIVSVFEMDNESNNKQKGVRVGSPFRNGFANSNKHSGGSGDGSGRKRRPVIRRVNETARFWKIVFFYISGKQHLQFFPRLGLFACLAFRRGEVAFGSSAARVETQSPEGKTTALVQTANCECCGGRDSLECWGARVWIGGGAKKQRRIRINRTSAKHTVRQK